MHIYIIKCFKNKKIYVGSSADVNRRLRGHLSNLKSNIHENVILQRAFNKYGEDAFSFEILETCLSHEDMLSREQYWINTFSATKDKDGYNMRPVSGSNLGFKHTPEAKEKIRQARLNKKHTPETKAKIAAKNAGNKNAKGAKYTDAQRQQCRLNRLGKKHKEETKLLMSIKMKKHRQLEREGKFGN